MANKADGVFAEGSPCKMMGVWREERDARWAHRVTELDGCQSRACVRLLLCLAVAVPLNLTSLAHITLPHQPSCPQQHSPDFEREPEPEPAVTRSLPTSAVAVARPVCLCVSLGPPRSLPLPSPSLSVSFLAIKTQLRSQLSKVTRSSTRQWARFKKGAVEVDFLIIRGTAA